MAVTYLSKTMKFLVTFGLTTFLAGGTMASAQLQMEDGDPVLEAATAPSVVVMQDDDPSYNQVERYGRCLASFRYERDQNAMTAAPIGSAVTIVSILGIMAACDNCTVSANAEGIYECCGYFSAGLCGLGACHGCTRSVSVCCILPLLKKMARCMGYENSARDLESGFQKKKIDMEYKTALAEEVSKELRSDEYNRLKLQASLIESRALSEAKERAKLKARARVPSLRIVMEDPDAHNDIL